MPVNHSAAGPSAGFAYQFHRALYWLASSPAGSLVGIETHDDVAVAHANDRSVREQDKYSLQANASPFGDRSKGLWNTLSIWIDAIESGQVQLASTSFLMVTNKIIPQCIARQISLAHSDREVSDCIAALEAVGANPPKTIAKIVRRTLDVKSRETLAGLIPKVELSDATDASASVELRKATLDQLQIPEWHRCSADSLADELLGWLQKTAMAAWSQNQPAWIPRDHFINRFHAALDRRKREKIRERAEHLIPVPDERLGKARASPFVTQLHLISGDETLVETSIREFVRCNIEKIRLSEEGNITDDDWETFETTLQSRWIKISMRVIRMNAGNPEEDVGYKIFAETTEGHRERLAGSETEQVYLTSGTYHRLANLLRVGWHPRYKDLMKELAKSDD